MSVRVQVETLEALVPALVAGGQASLLAAEEAVL